jgi:lambda family phage portal protein
VSAILDQYGQPIQTKRLTQRSGYVQRFGNRLKARYDVAQTTDENERHWANADFLSPNAAMTPAVRRKCRSRARYEAQENNSYAKGMILTLANDLISTGPRLQLSTPDKAANRRVERSFHDWADEVRLAEKLRTMRVAKAVDGETFALMVNNDRLASEVTLDIRPVEADYFEAPWGARPGEEQGIRFDEFGNPVDYWMCKQHPGGGSNVSMAAEGKWIPAAFILHCFRCDRPEQVRGLTEIVTALPLFAMLRRFTLATLAAAETAADFAAVMRTNTSASVEAESLPKDGWFDAIPLEYRAMLTLPNGWDITQLKAEHPTTTYAMFKAEIINEIARCLNMPFNVAAANSASYNYASGRMDHQVYHRSIRVEQSQWECCILDRIFRAWLDNATLIPGLLPENAGPFAEWPWQWFWDGQEHVDPTKGANARDVDLKNGMTHRGRELAKLGLDVDREDESAAESNGVTVEEYRRRVYEATFAASKADESTNEDQPSEEAAEAA